MSRDYYNQIAAEWRTALDAVRAAGGSAITLSDSHLTLILLGYEQHQQERANTLTWIANAERDRLIDATAAAYLRHRLGDLTDEQLADQLSMASSHQEQR
ncbi:hypothetical protein [Nonomuraea sp. NPDC049646]|uniref:hypothetical protein n=1 Tax=unclassified Nonomuraea TaxID=2593643 RepID=UPI003787DBC7